MNDTRAIEVLTEMLKKYPLTDTEREAIHEAMGILSWSKLIEGRIERMKHKRKKHHDDIG